VVPPLSNRGTVLFYTALIRTAFRSIIEKYRKRPCRTLANFLRFSSRTLTQPRQ